MQTIHAALRFLGRTLAHSEALAGMLYHLELMYLMKRPKDTHSLAASAVSFRRSPDGAPCEARNQ